MKQEHTSLGQEAKLNWLQIELNDLNFDRREKVIEALEKVTTEQVNTLFMEVFFENPRRLNLKIHSHTHRDDKVTRQTSIDSNADFYKSIDEKIGGDLQIKEITNINEFKRTHYLHPRL